MAAKGPPMKTGGTGAAKRGGVKASQSVPSASGPREVCFDYTRGLCSRGEQCRFRHDVAVSPAVRPGKGGGGRQRHPKSSPPLRSPRGPCAQAANRSGGICFDYTKGVCSRGEQCRFSHDAGAVQAVTKGRYGPLALPGQDAGGRTAQPEEPAPVQRAQASAGGAGGGRGAVPAPRPGGYAAAAAQQQSLAPPPPPPPMPPLASPWGAAGQAAPPQQAYAPANGSSPHVTQRSPSGGYAAVAAGSAGSYAAAMAQAQAEQQSFAAYGQAQYGQAQQPGGSYARGPANLGHLQPFPPHANAYAQQQPAAPPGPPPGHSFSDLTGMQRELPAYGGVAGMRMQPAHGALGSLAAQHATSSLGYSQSSPYSGATGGNYDAYGADSALFGAAAAASPLRHASDGQHPAGSPGGGAGALGSPHQQQLPGSSPYGASLSPPFGASSPAQRSPGGGLGGFAVAGYSLFDSSGQGGAGAPPTGGPFRGHPGGYSAGSLF